MTAQILDGRLVRDQIAKKLETINSKLETKPKLVIIQIGDIPESSTYINQKLKFGEKIGAIVELQKLPADISQKDIETKIQNLNSDPEVHGIIVQLPIPIHLDKDGLIEIINSKKDVDGLTSTNQKLLEENNPNAIVPATAKGVISILNFYQIPIKGKKVTVVGRSKLVGTPVATLFRNLDAQVTVCHSQTLDLKQETRNADIIVVAVGKQNLIGREHVSPNQTVVDVGINILEQPATSNQRPATSKLVGDVNFAEVSPIVSAITPVPGGIGPMTVASLFQNLLEAYKSQI